VCVCVCDACPGLICNRIPRTSAVFIVLCIITLTGPIQTVQFFTLCHVAAASTLLAYSVIAPIFGWIYSCDSVVGYWLYVCLLWIQLRRWCCKCRI